MQEIFFFKKKKYKIKNIFPNKNLKKNFSISNIRPLHLAGKSDLTFFDSIKYRFLAEKTKAEACITTKKLERFLPIQVEKILVENVLIELTKTLKKIYPFADIDYPDYSLKKPNKKKYKSVKFGNNVLIGINVKIGKNVQIGSNTIIEQGVIIGKDCVIGSGVIIKNSILGNNVTLQDNCKIGQKGFGFIPNKNKKFEDAPYWKSCN